MSPAPDSTGRRRFVRMLGLGALAGAFGALFAGGEARAQRKEAPPPAAAAPPPPSDEARALHAVLVGRYGAHLDAAQKESLLGALEGTVQSGRALRGRKLENAVEPDVIFAARAPREDRRGEAGR